MIPSRRKLFRFAASAYFIVVFALLVPGCAVHGVWYHPTASVGHVATYECHGAAAGKGDEWKLEREGVSFEVAPLYPKSVEPPGVGISITVPVDRVVKLSSEKLRLYDPSGRELNGEVLLFASNYLNYVSSTPVNEKLSPSTLSLKGALLANERYPETGYYFEVRLQKKLPTSFIVLLPEMEINGHNYPPLKIHFTKKPGTYFVTGINC